MDQQAYCISQMGNTIWLYEHWSAGKPLHRVANALRAAEEFPTIHTTTLQQAYILRIIISQMVGTGVVGPSNWALSTTQLPSDHSVVWIDLLEKTVSVMDKDAIVTKVTFSFKDFIERYSE